MRNWRRIGRKRQAITPESRTSILILMLILVGLVIVLALLILVR
jgi:hypothetical protein